MCKYVFDVNSFLGPTVGDRLKTSLQLIKRKLIKVNFFQTIPPSQEDNVIRQQCYSTRLYLILLFTSLSILLLFTSLRIQEITVTIKMPTKEKFIDLHNQYPLTLNCPCSQTTMKYNEFIVYMKPQYHEICLSEFVSSNWINVKFIKSSSTPFFINDLRSQFHTHFQLLATLCHAANQIVDDHLKSFYQTEFISEQVLSPKSFEIQNNLIMEQFNRTISQSFQNTLEVIKANQDINQPILPINSLFYWGLLHRSPFMLHSFFVSERPGCYGIHAPDCTCDTLSINECYLKTSIATDTNTEYIVPGMFFSWSPLESLLMSTLECLYDDLCLFQIKTFINLTVSPTNVSTLNSSSEYNTNNSYDKIEILANKVFIRSWKNESSFNAYFKQCHPLTCQYTYRSRLILIYIITTTIGLIGGLIVALRFLSPLIVKLALIVWNYVTCRQRDNITLAVNSSSIKLGKQILKINFKGEVMYWLMLLFLGFRSRFQLFLKVALRNVINLDFFSSKLSSQDAKSVCRNRYITRIYLLLLILTLIVILIYTALREDRITVTVNSPTVSDYQQLYMQYPLTLKCPCTRIAIKYNEFISQMKPHYHEICSSPFVSSEWINTLQRKTPFDFHLENDFRYTARPQFLIILKSCNLSQKVIDLSLSTFYQTNFVTANVISRSDFDKQTEAVINQFKRTTSDQFMQIFKLVQAINHGNQLATGVESNWRIIFKYLSNPEVPIISSTDLSLLTLEKMYETNNCSCATQSNCSEFASFYHRASNQSLKQSLSGFRIGCLPLDSLFLSSFSCLYNQSCLDIMEASIHAVKPALVNTLTYTPLMKPNTTIETILSQLFILKWSYDFSFDRYFNECNPQSCQYSYSKKYNRIYVLTTLIALFGGLTEGLHLIISYMSLVTFKLYDYIMKKKSIAVAPHSKQSNINPMDNENNALEGVSMPTIIAEQVIIFHFYRFYFHVFHF